LTSGFVATLFVKACASIAKALVYAISGHEPQLKITLLENLKRDLVSKVSVNAQWIKALR